MLLILLYTGLGNPINPINIFVFVDKKKSRVI